MLQTVFNIAGVAQSVDVAHVQKEAQSTLSMEAITRVLAFAIKDNRVLIWIYDNYDVDKLVLLAIHILAGIICIGAPPLPLDEVRRVGREGWWQSGVAVASLNPVRDPLICFGSSGCFRCPIPS